MEECKVKKIISVLTAASILFGSSVTIATAKSANEYSDEKIAVIANSMVDMHSSMYVDGSVFTAGTIRVNDAGGNKIDGKFISPTEGMDLIYWEGNPDTYHTDGYELYNINGGKVTAYSSKPEYKGAILDTDATFDYSVSESLFDVPSVDKYDYNTLDANEYSENIVTIDKDTSIESLSITGSGLIIDAQNGPVTLIIDTLSMPNNMSTIKVLGENTVNMYVDKFQAANGTINITAQPPSAENNWQGSGVATSENMNIYIGSDFEMSAGSMGGNLFVDADEIVVSGSSVVDGHITTTAQKVVIESSAKVYGVIYAPEADATIQRGGTLYGRVIADAITISNSASVRYDEDIISDYENSEQPEVTPTPVPTVEPTPTPEPTIPPYNPPTKLENNFTYLYGRTSTELAPDDTMYRGEACSVLYRLMRQNNSLNGFSYDESNEPAFRDLAGRWDRSAVEFMAYKGMYKANTNIGVGPMNIINRGEAFKLFCIGLNFTDDTTLTLEQYTQILQDAGYVVGDDNGELSLDKPITRGAFCKIYNMITGRDELQLITVNGEEVTTQTYGITDLDENWAEEILLRATSTFDANGFVDLEARAQRDSLDDYDYE